MVLLSATYMFGIAHILAWYLWHITQKSFSLVTLSIAMQFWGLQLEYPLAQTNGIGNCGAWGIWSLGKAIKMPIWLLLCLFGEFCIISCYLVTAGTLGLYIQLGYIVLKHKKYSALKLLLILCMKFVKWLKYSLF